MTKINGNQKYTYNTEAFTNEDANSFYLLGAFMSDGHVRHQNDSFSCGLTSKDKDWLESIAKLTVKNIEDFKIREKGNAFVIHLHSKIIYDWLVSKGCIERKSLILKFPIVPEKYIPDFMRGLIDGDGSVCMYSQKGKNAPCMCCCLYSASLDFINSFNDEVNKLNIECKVSQDKRRERMIEGRQIISDNPLYHVKVGGRKASELCKILYYPGHQISLNRKREMADKIISYFENSTRKPLKRLKPENINEIVSLIRDENLSPKEVAQKFNVSISTIHLIMKGKCWSQQSLIDRYALCNGIISVPASCFGNFTPNIGLNYQI